MLSAVAKKPGSDSSKRPSASAKLTAKPKKSRSASVRSPRSSSKSAKPRNVLQPMRNKRPMPKVQPLARLSESKHSECLHRWPMPPCM